MNRPLPLANVAGLLLDALRDHSHLAPVEPETVARLAAWGELLWMSLLDVQAWLDEATNITEDCTHDLQVTLHDIWWSCGSIAPPRPPKGVTLSPYARLVFHRTALFLTVGDLQEFLHRLSIHLPEPQ